VPVESAKSKPRKSWKTELPHLMKDGKWRTVRRAVDDLIEMKANDEYSVTLVRIPSTTQVASFFRTRKEYEGKQLGTVKEWRMKFLE